MKNSRMAFLSLKLATFQKHPLFVTPVAHKFLVEVGDVQSKSAVYHFALIAIQLDVNQKGEVPNAHLIPEDALVVCADFETYQFKNRWTFAVEVDDAVEVAAEV